jgi:Tfp pilus assembly protein PilO
VTRLWAHVAVFVGVVVLVAVGGYSFLGLPAERRRDHLAREVARLEGILQAVESAGARQNEFDRESREIEAQRAQLTRTIPESAEEQPYLRAFDAEARSLGVGLASLRWAKHETRDSSTAAPFKLTVRGEPGRVLLFASRILSGDPLIEVRSLEIKNASRPIAELTLEAQALSLAESAQ